jgi:hypothetical protein
MVVGTLVLVEVERLPRGERRREPRVLWLWWHGGPEGEAASELGFHLARLRPPVRSGAHVPLPQTGLGMDDASGAPPRAGRPLDVAGGGRFRPAQTGAGERGGSAAALGASLQRRATDADAGPPGRFGAFGALGHASEASKTLRKIAWAAQGAPFRPGEALPGAEKDGLSPRRRQTGSFVTSFMSVAKLPVVKTQAKSLFCRVEGGRSIINRETTRGPIVTRR